MKKIVCLVLALVMALSLLAGCGSKPADDGGNGENNGGNEGQEPAGEKVKVALIASSSGLGDRSFNDGAWAGFQKAEKELGVEIQVVEPEGVADYQSAAASLANAGYQLIFATGNDWGDTITEVAAQYPEVCFVGLNVTATGDNVAVAQTADHQLGFLAGALAAMMSESGTVGYIGGKEVPSQVRFEVGYEEGVAYINESCKVLPTYVGAFNDPATGKEFALELINQGADVIFHTAGQSGGGMFEAVGETDGVYAIGVDSNQDGIVEGKVLTSTLKNLDAIAYDMIERVVGGNFTSGTVVYDLTNGGVGLTDMEFTKDAIGEEKLAKLDEIKAGIIDGSIAVTDTYAQ